MLFWCFTALKIQPKQSLSKWSVVIYAKKNRWQSVPFGMSIKSIQWKTFSHEYQIQPKQISSPFFTVTMSSFFFNTLKEHFVFFCLFHRSGFVSLFRHTGKVFSLLSSVSVGFFFKMVKYIIKSMGKNERKRKSSKEIKKQKKNNEKRPRRILCWT